MPLKKITNKEYKRRYKPWISKRILNSIIRKNRANGILSKSRHYVSPNILKEIYYAIFSSHLTYGSQIWGQSINSYIDKISIIQGGGSTYNYFCRF